MMTSVVCSAASSSAVVHQQRTTRRAIGTSVRPCVQPCVSVAPRQSVEPAARRVEVRFFKFRQSSEDAGIVGSQGRGDYNYDDVEQYFNYMGFLAEEGTYDRMEAMLKSGLHPIDIILLLACSENDTPKIGEILKAGADVRVKGIDGRTPLQIATKAETVAILKEYESKSAVAA